MPDAIMMWLAVAAQRMGAGRGAKESSNPPYFVAIAKGHGVDEGKKGVKRRASLEEREARDHPP